MIIGIPREVKDNENRVSMTPGGVEAFRRHDHQVLVETGAGQGSGITDEEYEAAGAKVVDAGTAWGADLVIKVKEPIESEYKYLREDLTLFTYLHLAANRQLTDVMLDSKVTGVAYETVQLNDGSLPLLTPMSEVAGRMATQEGSHHLEKYQGGRGVLLGGVPGVKPASVVIIGAGVVGTNAARIAVGMGALVTMIDISHSKLQYLDDIYHGRIITLNSTEPNIRQAAMDADLIIGAVLIPGGKAPMLITEGMIKRMREGAVIIDVAVDQGGCVETIKPTTLAKPTYVLDGVVHYGVTNMPGAVPRTSTFALVNVTLPYALALADKGMDAMRHDPALAKGLNTHKGGLTYKAVAEAFDMDFEDPGRFLN
jgi:alanine dehydrogenase